MELIFLPLISLISADTGMHPCTMEGLIPVAMIRWHQSRLAVAQFLTEPARIPGTMEQTKDNHAVFLDPEVHRIGKT
jgi:hypothetical protein